ncbi:hypothetical protein V6Z12_A02G026600 [Gossypium hirsutum]
MGIKGVCDSYSTFFQKVTQLNSHTFLVYSV